jgi:hypothetical protein
MAKAQDRDLELKLRFRRILFFQGYWTPIEVELSHYEANSSALKRTSLTDLDVLGVKYDSLFTVSRAVADCKSGRRVSDANRLFWLKGVKDYFGADQAYFIHPSIDNHARVIAPKMGLRILNEDALTLLEKNLAVANMALPLADVDVYTAIRDLWGIDVPKGNKPSNEQLVLKDVYSYLAYRYWYIEQNRNVLTLIKHFQHISPLLDESSQSDVLLAYTGLERFAHCLLEMASHISAQGGTNILRDARNYLYGGSLALREKERFFQLLRDLTNSNEQLDPPYLAEVIELLNRMVQHPKGASDVLRHIIAIYMWCVHLGETSLVPLNNGVQNIAAIVLTRDIANTFVKVTGVRKALYTAIEAL